MASLYSTRASGRHHPVRRGTTRCLNEPGQGRELLVRDNICAHLVDCRYHLLCFWRLAFSPVNLGPYSHAPVSPRRLLPWATERLRCFAPCLDQGKWERH